MNHEEAMEAEILLQELMENNFAKTKAARLLEIFQGIFDNERLKKERKVLGLKSSYVTNCDPSQVVSRMIEGLVNIPNLHQESYEDIGRLNNATNDVLHAIELLDMTEEQEHETMNIIRNIRKQRRIAKDYMELSEPLVKFANKHPKLAEELRSVAGEIHKIKERHDGKRTYKPRQIASLEDAFKTTEQREKTAMEIAFQTAQESAATKE